MTSFPPKPQITSAEIVPRNTSGPAVPLISQTPPLVANDVTVVAIKSGMTSTAAPILLDAFIVPVLPTSMVSGLAPL